MSTFIQQGGNTPQKNALQNWWRPSMSPLQVGKNLSWSLHSLACLIFKHQLETLRWLQAEESFISAVGAYRFPPLPKVLPEDQNLRRKTYHPIGAKRYFHCDWGCRVSVPNFPSSLTTNTQHRLWLPWGKTSINNLVVWGLLSFSKASSALKNKGRLNASNYLTRLKKKKVMHTTAVA